MENISPSLNNEVTYQMRMKFILDSFTHSYSPVQAFAASVFVFSGDVEALIGRFNAAQWVFIGLVFVGLLIMRVTYSHEKRLFKVRKWLCTDERACGLDAVLFLYFTGVVDSARHYDCGLTVSHHHAARIKAWAFICSLCHNPQWSSSVHFPRHGDTMETETNHSGPMQWYVNFTRHCNSYSLLWK